MRRRRLARGVLCVAAACLLGASDAPGPPDGTLRRDLDVIFTAEQTVRLRPPMMCDAGLEADTLRAWTPTEDDALAAARLRWATIFRTMPELEKAAKDSEIRQFFGIFCGGERRLQVISMFRSTLPYTEPAMEPGRPPGYDGPLWRVLPFDYWGDIEAWFDVYDPARKALVPEARVAWAHRGAFPPPNAPPTGGTCIALGFGAWTGYGANWLPLGWEERFPHLELRPEAAETEGSRRLRLAPHSPRPALPTVMPGRSDRRFALVFDEWTAPKPRSLHLLRSASLGMGLSVRGTWRGDTLRGRATTWSDNHGPDEPEADAFAVRYPCDDARAAAAADAAMELLRTGARTAGEGR